MPKELVVVEAVDAAAIDACRELFKEYQRGLGVSLCFQGFDAELAALPGDYAPPRGRLLLAHQSGVPAGCVALRPLFHRDAEMKRLYVRAAQNLYAKLGFRDTAPYNDNPVAGVRFLSLDLQSRRLLDQRA